MKIGLLFLALIPAISANAETVARYTPDIMPQSGDMLELAGPIYRLKVPLQFLKGAKIVESDGISILLEGGKGIYISTENSRSLGMKDTPVSEIPRMLAENDFSGVSNDDERKDLEGMSRVNRNVIRPEIVGHLTLNRGEAFVFIGQNKSSIFIVSPENPDVYTSINIDKLSKQEIDTYLLQGALR